MLEALNAKGIKEKNLLDRLKEAIANGHLDLKDVKIEDESTVTGTTATSKKDEQDMNFWYAKIQEYTAVPEPEEEENETTRTTRSKAQEQTAGKITIPRPRDLKYVTLAGVKELLEKTDAKLTDYLNKWNARWGTLKSQEEIVK